MLSEAATTIFEKINLFERYKGISERFNSEKTLEAFDQKEVAEIFYDQNCDFTFDRKESFFGLTEEMVDYQFKLNISLKYGVVEAIFWAKGYNTEAKFGGPVIRMAKQVQLAKGVKEIERIPYP